MFGVEWVYGGRGKIVIRLILSVLTPLRAGRLSSTQGTEAILFTVNLLDVKSGRMGII